MRKIIPENGKKITLDTENDTQIFNDWQVDDTRWNMVYTHKCNDGRVMYYTVYNTQWENEHDRIEVISKEEFIAYVEDRVWAVTEEGEKILDSVDEA